MAKRKLNKEISTTEDKKSSSIIDYIDWLTIKKKTWNELTFEDKKAFNPYILNRFLSMDLFLCGAVNEIQKAFGGAEKDVIWKVYYEILPEQKLYLKYIKAKGDEIDEKSLRNLRKYFNINDNDALIYYSILTKSNEGKQEIETINSYFIYEKN